MGIRAGAGRWLRASGNQRGRRHPPRSITAIMVPGRKGAYAEFVSGHSIDGDCLTPGQSSGAGALVLRLATTATMLFDSP